MYLYLYTVIPITWQCVGRGGGHDPARDGQDDGDGHGGLVPAQAVAQEGDEEEAAEGVDALRVDVESGELGAIKAFKDLRTVYGLMANIHNYLIIITKYIFHTALCAGLEISPKSCVSVPVSVTCVISLALPINVQIFLCYLERFR